VRGTTLRRRGATPLADLPRLRSAAGRTTLLRAAFALGLAATLAAAMLLARGAGAGRAAVLPEGATTGVVALDVSASIAGNTYGRVAGMLRGIAAANQSIGLVMFSDVAFELLPPNSPPGALLQFLPYFKPLRISEGSPVFARNPWDSFSGGTRIAVGLKQAAAALRRAHVTRGSILLVSDLDDGVEDREPLAAEAVALKHQHIPVRILPLYAAPSDRSIFASLFGADAFIKASAFAHSAGRHSNPLAADSAWALLGVGALLVLQLAGNERANARLELGVPA
jgi:hypothetical protein